MQEDRRPPKKKLAKNENGTRSEEKKTRYEHVVRFRACLNLWKKRCRAAAASEKDDRVTAAATSTTTGCQEADLKENIDDMQASK